MIVVIAILLATGAAYVRGWARLGRRWPWWRAVAAAGGLAALGVALAGPVDAAADRSLAAHMVQHLLIAAVAPALLSVSAPVRLALGALDPAPRHALGRLLRGRVAGILGQPGVALPLSVAVLVGAHVGPVFEAALEHPALHAAEHALLFWTALAAWMVLLGVDPLPHRVGAVGRLTWLTVLMTGMGVVGAALVSADHVVFAAYASRPGALDDQHLGGTVMWVGSALLLVPATLAACAHALWREERHQRRREAAEVAR